MAKSALEVGAAGGRGRPGDVNGVSSCRVVMPSSWELSFYPHRPLGLVALIVGGGVVELQPAPRPSQVTALGVFLAWLG